MVANRISGGVQSVERAFYLLELLADSGDLSLTELSASINLPAPTSHRLLKTLVSLGYVRQLPNRRYGLGLGLVRLAGQLDADSVRLRSHIWMRSPEKSASRRILLYLRETWGLHRPIPATAFDADVHRGRPPCPRPLDGCRQGDPGAVA